jgi:hypothetical protein
MPLTQPEQDLLDALDRQASSVLNSGWTKPILTPEDARLVDLVLTTARTAKDKYGVPRVHMLPVAIAAAIVTALKAAIASQAPASAPPPVPPYPDAPQAPVLETPLPPDPPQERPPRLHSQIDVPQDAPGTFIKYPAPRPRHRRH